MFGLRHLQAAKAGPLSKDVVLAIFGTQKERFVKAHRLESSNGSFDYRKNYIFNFLTGQEGEFQEVNLSSVWLVFLQFAYGG